MTFQVTQDRVVFEGKNFVIVDIQDKLPKHKHFPRGSYDVKKPWNGKPAVNGSYYEIKDRNISILYCHQTAGSVTRHGIDAPIATTRFVTNDPNWVQKTIKGKLKWVWTGTGRGWPGCCYTYYVPYKPLFHQGKIVIFRCWHNDWVTWHSSHNKPSISLTCQGYFKSRHMRSFKAKRGCPGGKPSGEQMQAVEGFILEYAIDELGISNDQIKGHYDSPYPKPTCPGDPIENYVEVVKQGKAAPTLVEPELPPQPMLDGMLVLDTWEERQAALVLAGHDIGSYGKLKNGVDGDPGYKTRAAIEAQEEQFGLKVDGYWDDTFDYIMKLYLLGMGVDDKELQALIP